MLVRPPRKYIFELAAINSVPTVFSLIKHSRTEDRPHVILVSHEASLTGAPKIALNLLRHIRRTSDVDLTAILHNGGPLHGEFEAECDTICLNVPREHHPTIHTQIRKLLKPLQRNGKKVVCLCNSVESRFIANSISTRQIPILYLLHEYPTSYQPAEFAKIYNYSKRLIFPCRSVRNAADRTVPLPDSGIHILPQGLLDDQFGTRMPRDLARKRLRRRLGIAADAFVVLGCGTVDLRKGIDHFMAVARTYEQLHGSDRPVYFCWVGDGPRHPHSAHHYVHLDIVKSNQTNVRMIGETTNVEPLFLGADSFLLTSRVDPFPCVIHEAMAARLPIIVFNESGGAVEAVGNGAGIVVPFANYAETCRSINRLLNDRQYANGIATQGFERVHQKYRFEDYAESVIDLIEQEIEQPIRQGRQGQSPKPDTRMAA